MDPTAYLLISIVAANGFIANGQRRSVSTQAVPRPTQRNASKTLPAHEGSGIGAGAGFASQTPKETGRLSESGLLRVLIANDLGGNAGRTVARVLSFLSRLPAPADHPGHRQVSTAHELFPKFPTQQSRPI